MKRLIVLSAAAAFMAGTPTVFSALSDSSPSYPAIQYHIPLSGFNKAWEVTEGSQSVKVAVIDTGFDIGHPEFASANIDPLSFSSNEIMVGVENVMDDGGHGTLVLGVMAASNRDSEGVSGVAPGLTFMVIKANKVPANIYSGVRVGRGIRYAADNGAFVINLSMAAVTHDPELSDAVAYAASKGVLIVVAAGNNSSQNPYYPAAYDNVIAVSSVDESGSFSGFSNYGEHIDISAYGSRITTTRLWTTDTTRTKDVSVSGTSLAAPQVAAALAMVKSANPEMTPEQVRDRVLSTARDAGDPGFDNRFGHGILDMKAALGIQDPVEPPPSSSSETVASSSEQESAPSSNSQPSSSEISSSQPSSETSSSEPVSQPPAETTRWRVKFIVIKSLYREFNVEDGQTVEVPPPPSIRLLRPHSRMAIVFTGWFTESGERFNFSSPITSDLVLTAKFRMVRIIVIMRPIKKVVIEE